MNIFVKTTTRDFISIWCCSIRDNERFKIKNNDHLTVAEYNIKRDSTISILIKQRGGGYIDNLREEINKSIGFDLNLIKRNELNIDLIFFDFNMAHKENYYFYNKFKIDVIGGFHSIDDIDSLKD